MKWACEDELGRSTLPGKGMLLLVPRVSWEVSGLPRPGPQPPSPEVKPNGQVTWTKKEKQVDPKAPWESERNTCLRASEGLYLPYGLQEVVLAKFLDLKKKFLL